MKVVEPAMRKAAEAAEERAWREGLDDSPHGQPWHTSFHASSFPGDDERSCLRYHQYVLMDAPRNEPAPMRLAAQGAVGSAAEELLVKWFGRAEVLLSADRKAEGGDGLQTGFADKENWLTGAVDVVLVPEGWDRPHVVEVKTKALNVVQAMQRGERGPDGKHVNQCKAYIGFAHELSADLWPDLKPCQDGSVFYLARDDDFTSVTHEFFYSYDPDFMLKGRLKLREAREAFQRGDLLPHPFGGREWSIDPCKFCQFKKHVCKPDDKEGITRLRDSHAVPWAEEVRGEYDYDAKRQAVLGRWGAKDMESEEG